MLPVASCEDDGSPGTLRSVIAAAVSGDIVDLSALTCSTITLTRGAIQVDVDDLTLHGPGAALSIDGNEMDRVLFHHGYGTLSIDHLTVARGRYDSAEAAGGCIASLGNVALVAATVSSCTIGTSNVPGYGGGIFVSGILSMTSSTLERNTAADRGGGAYVFGGGVYMMHSTISDNHAGHAGGGLAGHAYFDINGSTISDNYAADVGGGIFDFGSVDRVVSISDSTISGNKARHGGGGIWSDLSPLHLRNSTIAFNVAGYGGAGIFDDSTFAPELQSSIVARNVVTPAGDHAADIASPYLTEIVGSHNLIMSSDLSVPNDTLSADPELMPLADNGGATRTQALDATSPAIDTGNNTDGLDFDQRGDGYARVVGSAADIGAFEVQSARDQIFLDGFDP